MGLTTPAMANQWKRRQTKPPVCLFHVEMPHHICCRLHTFESVDSIRLIKRECNEWTAISKALFVLLKFVYRRHKRKHVTVVQHHFTAAPVNLRLSNGWKLCVTLGKQSWHPPEWIFIFITSPYCVTKKKTKIVSFHFPWEIMICLLVSVVCLPKTGGCSVIPLFLVLNFNWHFNFGI